MILSQIEQKKKIMVLACCGHFREISSIDKKTFDVKFKYSKGKFKYIQNIRKNISGKDIYIATDNDREGESIGWHLCDIFHFDSKKIKRLRFNDLSFPTVKYAYEHPSFLSQNLIDAALTRQIVDRWIGFQFSPRLSKFCNQKGLSAGRCQTPTLKLVFDKEEEKKKITQETYFQCNAIFHKYLFSLSCSFETKEEGFTFIEKNKQFSHTYELPFHTEKKERHPPKPFKTSTIQQFCSSYWKWSPMVTMKQLQQLYEEGKITYHRTESIQLSNSFIKKGLEFIEKEYGEKYKTKKNLYSSNSFAHEAIRPTDISKIDDKNKLYSLIRNQTLKSLMSFAEIEETLVQIKTPFPNIFFKRTFSSVIFDGFLKLDKKEMKSKEIIPKTLKSYSSIELKEVPKKYISSYNEGNIIKKLEELKIGRPSTFASFLSKIQYRNYVDKKDLEYIFPRPLSIWTMKEDKIKEEKKEWKEVEKSKIVINSLGRKVIDFLYENYSKYFNYEYTSEIEQYLDDISEGKLEKDTLLKEIYEKLKKNLI
jgi:DNA topoisomerase-1